MIKVVSIGALLLAISFSSAAEPARPSDASIDQLSMLVNSKQQYEQFMKIYEKSLVQAMEQAGAGKPDDPSRELRIKRASEEFVSFFRKEMDFDSMAPILRNAYADTFTQQEVDALIQFYSSPAGVALLKKMPTVMERMMLDMQAHFADRMPKIQQQMTELTSKVNE